MGFKYANIFRTKGKYSQSKKATGIAQFNDWFRDSIKGSTFNLYDRGFALGNDHYYESAKQVLFGSIGIERPTQGIFLEPTQSVNYVESHDNHTLWDKLAVCKQDADILTKQKRHLFATVMVLLSQGIPFLHSGQEFFRTKKGIGNSYRSPDDVNWINWENKSVYRDNVEFVKGIINIRKSHGAFRLPTANIIRNYMSVLQVPKPVIGYFLKKVACFGKWNNIVVYFNPTRNRFAVDLPCGGEWFILVDENTANSTPIGKIESSQYLLAPISISVLVQ